MSSGTPTAEDEGAETVYATEPEDAGEVRTEGVPFVGECDHDGGGECDDRVDGDGGQATLDEWGLPG